MIASLSLAAVLAVDVTLVASPADAQPMADALAQRLLAAGHADVRFRRCEDFGCVDAPHPADPPAVVIVVEESAHATLIVTRGDASDVIVDDIDLERPLTPVDTEALGFAVLRALSEPPLRLRTDWAAAKQLGLRAAPVPEPEPEPPAPPRPPAAVDRGPYVELGVGAASSLSSEYVLSSPAMLGAGFVFCGRGESRLRVSLGARAWFVDAFGRDSGGLASGEARLGVGVSTRRLLARAHLGIGPGVGWSGGYRQPTATGLATAGASLVGHVGQRFAAGVELGATFDIANENAALYGLLTGSVFWDLPRGRGKRGDR